MMHHRFSVISLWQFVEIDMILVLQTHVNIVHHLSQYHGITAVVFNNDVKHDLVTKVVTLSIEQHVARAVMLVCLGCFCLYLQFEKFIWPDIVLHYHVTHI